MRKRGDSAKHVATTVRSGKVETKQALSATDKICHSQEIDKQLGSAVIGTPLGIAPNAT